MTTLSVSVAWQQGNVAQEQVLCLNAPATLGDALEQLRQQQPAAADALAAAAAFGVWGKVRPTDQLLRDGDRVEIYQPLRTDPKEARRENAGRARSGRSKPPPRS